MPDTNDSYDTIPLRELEALVAVRYFGWRWFAMPGFPGRSKDLVLVGLWPASSSREFERNNFHVDSLDVTGYEEEFERFSDWDRQGIPRARYSGMPIMVGFPRWARDPKVAMDLLKSIARDHRFPFTDVQLQYDMEAEDDYEQCLPGSDPIEIRCIRHEEWMATILPDKPGAQRVYGTDQEEPGAAICRALLRALDAIGHQVEKGRRA